MSRIGPGFPENTAILLTSGGQWPPEGFKTVRQFSLCRLNVVQNVLVGYTAEQRAARCIRIEQKRPNSKNGRTNGHGPDSSKHKAGGLGHWCWTYKYSTTGLMTKPGTTPLKCLRLVPGVYGQHRQNLNLCAGKLLKGRWGGAGHTAQYTTMYYISLERR